MAARRKSPAASSIPTSFEVRLPASTSNLGAGFDCFGLALKLYLNIRATLRPHSPDLCRVRTTGPRENRILPRNATNLIYRAMSFAATREQITLPPLDLAVHNEIPLASGLGSSAAAIVGGIKLCGLISDRPLPDQSVLTYATEFEEHPDNVAAALLGGFVASCIDANRDVVSVKTLWPVEIKVVVVSPQSQLPTHVARAALPRMVKRTDAVNNLQRSAIFLAAVTSRRFDLFREAMRDKLHQPHRESLVPGLAEALALPSQTGMLGIALSGAGPSILALVADGAEEVGKKIASCFGKYQIRSTTRILEVDNEGCQVLQPGM
jgi:homoserine kinase